MLKPFILANICGVLSSTVLANTPLTPYTELTNLDTQGYVWKVEFRSNDKGSKFNSTLVNPHPQLDVLNQRVLEIAEDYKYRLRNNKDYEVSLNAPYTLSANGKTKIYQQPYVLEIKFPLFKNTQDLHWKKKPDGSAIITKINLMCTELENVPQITANWQVTTRLDGKIVNAQLMPNPEYSDDTQKFIYENMHKIILSASLVPRNKDGVPYVIQGTQSFKMYCQKK